VTLSIGGMTSYDCVYYVVVDKLFIGAELFIIQRFRVDEPKNSEWRSSPGYRAAPLRVVHVGGELILAGKDWLWPTIREGQTGQGEDVIELTSDLRERLFTVKNMGFLSKPKGEYKMAWSVAVDPLVTQYYN